MSAVQRVYALNALLHFTCNQTTHVITHVTNTTTKTQVAREHADLVMVIVIHVTPL